MIENEKFNQIVWQTELSLYGKMSASKPQWSMWLDLSVKNLDQSSALQFKLVKTDEDWSFGANEI